MRKLTQKELSNIENNEFFKCHNLEIDEWDKKWFPEITGMNIATAFEQGMAGAEAFRKYAAWQDSGPHVTL